MPDNQQFQPERSIGLRLPQAIFDAYDAQAQAKRLPVEDLMEEKLSLSVSQRDNRPIYFTDEERNTLDELVGRNLRSAADVIDQVSRCLKFRVTADGPVTIELSPTLLERLHNRHFTDEKFGSFIKRLVIEGLEREVGMR